MTVCQTKIALCLALWGAGESAGRAAQSAGVVPPDSPALGIEVAPGVRHIGQIGHPRLSESSGVVASRQFPGVLWTHNDGGGGRKQVLFAINREGKTLAEFLIVDALLVDWEDIAIDSEGRLYLGDLGNNDLKRRELAVHQVEEPDPQTPARFLQVKRSWRLRFPAEPFDCESLFIWDHYGYLVSKVFKDAHAQIFRFPLDGAKNVQVLELVATTRIDSPVTGADISADGRLLGLVAKSGAFVYKVHGDISRAGRVKPVQTRFRHEHIEACTFVPEGLLATAESREIYLFTDPAFRPHARRGKNEAASDPAKPAVKPPE